MKLHTLLVLLYSVVVTGLKESTSSVRHEFLRSNNNTTLVTGDSCTNLQTCEECTTASSWCHWCGHDKACHAKGSVYGCVWGETCDEQKPKKNDTDPSGCAAHQDCRSCASSHLCHWCGHDNACHAIGSVYGCTVGVDCYSNDRCQRKESEPFQDFDFPHIGPLPLMIIGVTALTLLCCFTVCFCVASGLKGAYDDLAGIHDRGDGRDGLDEAREPLLHQVVEVPMNATEDFESAAENPEQEGDQEDAEEANVEDGNQAPEDGVQRQVSFAQQASISEYETIPRNRSRRRPRHMQRLYNACAFAYFLSVAAVLSISVLAYMYAPIKPTYNICNDDVAWKSIIESLATLKVGAEFEILASVANPNRIDVALDSGGGSFRHDDVPIGTFIIPPVVAKARSITDVLVVASLSPEKWEALSLTKEYYRGKLVLSVDTQATIRVPALFDYRFTAELKNIVVNVNEMSDRSLCACPTWNDNVTDFISLL